MRLKIGIYETDSKKCRRNLAIEKIKMYHRLRGDEVETYNEILRDKYAKVYCQSLFNFTQKPEIYKNFETGGTGFDINKKLPQEIDSLKPHINSGYTTRGCIRSCSFCVIPEKEGPFKIIGDLIDLWDGRHNLINVMDNNITASESHFIKILKQSRELNLRLFFEQGLDYRLLTGRMVEEIAKSNIQHLTFAFDSPDDFSGVERALEMLKRYNIKYQRWYMILGYWTTIKQDIKKLNFMKHRVWSVYALVYNENPRVKILRRWVNHKRSYKETPVDSFILLHGDAKTIELYRQEGVITDETYKNLYKYIKLEEEKKGQLYMFK